MGVLTGPRTGPSSLGSIPVVLANDYAIDRPLRVGASAAQAHGEAVDELTPNLLNGFILRGGCGPATRRLGAALIKAARGFSPAASLGTVPEVSSMFVARTQVVVTVENVVFDANELANRCVTLVAAGGEVQHHTGFSGCDFRNARLELVWIGCETKTPTVESGGAVLDLTAPGDAAYFKQGKDLSSTRFTRCRFDTGTQGSIQETLRQLEGDLPPKFTKGVGNAGIWRIGVVFRAKESLGTEFHACTFTGPASPMILAIGGRLSLQNCAFRTELVNPPSMSRSSVVVPSMMTTLDVGTDPTVDFQRREWNGTDLFLAAGFSERYASGATTSSRTSRKGDSTSPSTAPRAKSSPRSTRRTVDRRARSSWRRVAAVRAIRSSVRSPAARSSRSSMSATTALLHRRPSTGASRARGARA